MLYSMTVRHGKIILDPEAESLGIDTLILGHTKWPTHDWRGWRNSLIASVPRTENTNTLPSLEPFATTTTDDLVKPTRYAFLLPSLQSSASAFI